MEHDSEKNAANLAGAQIRSLRIKATLTQKDLAAKIEIQGVLMARSTLAKIENRTRQITDIELVAFAKALKVTPNELVKK